MILKKKQNFGSKGKNASKSSISYENIFNGHPSKNVTIIVAYSFVSEHSKHFFYVEKKKLAFLSSGGGRLNPFSGRVR